MPDPAVTIRHVAAAAGVHPATASRALNPETRILVSAETAERVLRVAKSLGYHPNPMARTLRTRRSHTVGVLIPDITNPLFPPIIRGLEDRLAAAGYVALIGNTDGDGGRERFVFEQMRARRVDGFVMATARLRDPLLAEAARAEIPVVLVNRVTEGYSFPAVSVDNERGSQLAVAHLAALGHRRIAHIAGPQDVSTGPSRLRGFMAGMAVCDLEVIPRLVTYATAYSIQEGVRCCRDLLRRPEPWTAVVAANDMLAVGAYSALEEAGLKCPGDVSVTGFNDMPFIDRLSPPLTSVRFAHYQVGTEAARLLLEQLASQVPRVGPVRAAPGMTAPGATAPDATVPDLTPPDVAASGVVASEGAASGGAASDVAASGVAATGMAASGPGDSAVTAPDAAAPGLAVPAARGEATGQPPNGSAEPVKILFLAPELIVRGSTAPAAHEPARRHGSGAAL